MTRHRSDGHSISVADAPDLTGSLDVTGGANGTIVTVDIPRVGPMKTT
ncbi:hypothetical protein [Tropicimonas sp. IMCC34011]|nr:hypothetical protein [Tropicimonas sp. IMCC34011]